MPVLLVRDEILRARNVNLAESHLRTIRAVHAGTGDLSALHARKLLDTLAGAAHSKLHADSLHAWRDGRTLAEARTLPADVVLTKTLSSVPLLDRGDLQARSHDAFTRQVTGFLHYYESSGTTGDPVAAPKAVDDLVVNTMNIGEMWGRFLDPSDSALILINGPFAPAGYQFEKVLEYLGVLSMRLWVDNVTGDYTRVLRLSENLRANVYVGTASRLLELVHFALRNDTPPPRFDRLLLMAEQTGDALLQHLEQLTGATAFVASYGSSETGTTAVTCERGSLHLQLQSYLLELHDERGTRLVSDRPDSGELVVTTLDLPARPLVRYRTGDLVEMTGEPCRCGLALPVIRTLGRRQDVITLGGVNVRQEDFEATLWSCAGAGPAVLNYMLVVRGQDVVCLVTTDQPPSDVWVTATTDRLGASFAGRRFGIGVVDTLPPMATMGSYVGWKLSRVLDLDDARTWSTLPAPIEAVLRETLQQVEASTGLRPAHHGGAPTEPEGITNDGS
jgi:phenylacetate-CoA ligase